VIPLIRRNWSLELMEERSAMLWDDSLLTQALG
jgi:hypothetical protein